MTIISLRRSSTAAKVPADLQIGETEINYTDRKIYGQNDADETVVVSNEVRWISGRTYEASAGVPVNGNFPTPGDVVIASNGRTYIANSPENKGSAVVLSNDPATGDGSSAADWVLVVADTTVDTALDRTSDNALSNKVTTVTIESHGVQVPVGESIQDAIDKVVSISGANGGRVILAPGDHTIDARFVVPDNVNVSCEVKHSAKITTTAAESIAQIAAGARNAGLENLHLDQANTAASEILLYSGTNQHEPILKHCLIENLATGPGFLMARAYNPQIIGNEFVNVGTPIQIYEGVDRAKIADNIFRDWYQRCIYLTSITAGISHVDMHILNNIVYDPAAASAGESYVRQPIAFAIPGDNATYHRDAKVIGNHVYGPDMAYHTHYDTQPEKDATIGTADNISLSGVDGFEVSDNISNQSGDMGFTIEQSKNGFVRRNYAERNNSAGYTVGADPTPSMAPISENVQFEGNEAVNNRLDRGNQGKIKVNYQCLNGKNIRFVNNNRSYESDYMFDIRGCEGFLDENNPDAEFAIKRIYGAGWSAARSGLQDSLVSRQIMDFCDKLGIQMYDDITYDETTQETGSPIAHSVQTIPLTGRHVVEFKVTDTTSTWIGVSEDFPSAYGSMSHMILKSSTFIQGPNLDGAVNGTFSETGGSTSGIGVGDVLHWVVQDGVVSLWKNWVLLHTYVNNPTNPLRVFVFASSTWADGFGAKWCKTLINHEPVRWHDDAVNRVRWSFEQPYKRDAITETIDATAATDFTASAIDAGRVTKVTVDVKLGEVNCAVPGIKSKYFNKHTADINIQLVNGATATGNLVIQPNHIAEVSCIEDGVFVVIAN